MGYNAVAPLRKIEIVNSSDVLFRWNGVDNSQFIQIGDAGGTLSNTVGRKGRRTIQLIKNSAGAANLIVVIDPAQISLPSRYTVRLHVDELSTPAAFGPIFGSDGAGTNPVTVGAYMGQSSGNVVPIYQRGAGGFLAGSTTGKATDLFLDTPNTHTGQIYEWDVEWNFGLPNSIFAFDNSATGRRQFDTPNHFVGIDASFNNFLATTVGFILTPSAAGFEFCRVVGLEVLKHPEDRLTVDETDPLIARVDASGFSANMNLDLTQLPAGDIELTYALRGTGAASTASVTLNGVTSALYDCTYARIDDAAVLAGSASDGINQIAIRGPNFTDSAHGDATAFTMGRAFVPDYKGSNYSKGIYAGQDFAPIVPVANNQFLQLWGGFLKGQTGPLTDINFAAGAGNWAAGSYLQARILPTKG